MHMPDFMAIQNTFTFILPAASERKHMACHSSDKAVYKLRAYYYSAKIDQRRKTGPKCDFGKTFTCACTGAAAEAAASRTAGASADKKGAGAGACAKQPATTNESTRRTLRIPIRPRGHLQQRGSL